MELLIPFHINPSLIKIFYEEKIFFMGSCFSEEIGKRMMEMKFTVVQSPNGILYDPASISTSLLSYITGKKYTDEDLFYLNELWHSWQHHSSFSGINKKEVLQNINSSQSNASKHLKDTSWLVITPGSAYNYVLKETVKAIANCHKAASNLFEKNLLSTQQIIDDLSMVITKLQNVHSNLKIIFTISPVRHVKDGVIENNRSKARLIEAIHTLKGAFENVLYFPAYELVIDVLRDYRFYKNDLVHPSETAIDFVFEKFCEAFLDASSLKLMEEIKAIKAGINHRPFNKETGQHQQFKNKVMDKMNMLTAQHPYIDFSIEKNTFL